MAELGVFGLSLIALDRALIEIDPTAVDGTADRARIEQIAVGDLDSQPLQRAPVGARPSQHPHGGARRHQLAGDVGADEARAARD